MVDTYKPKQGPGGPGGTQIFERRSYEISNVSGLTVPEWLEQAKSFVINPDMPWEDGRLAFVKYSNGRREIQQYCDDGMLEEMETIHPVEAVEF